jgi:hypothetical protein
MIYKTFGHIFYKWKGVWKIKIVCISVKIMEVEEGMKKNENGEWRERSEMWGI